MPVVLVVLLSVHVLGAIAWAGPTLVVARTPALASPGLFMGQMGAAAVVVLSGAGAWLASGGPVELQERILGVGIATAVLALLVQIVARRWPGPSNRIAALLLAVATVSMVAVRFPT